MRSDRDIARVTRNRIIGLIVLGIVAVLFFAATVFWAHADSDSFNPRVRERGEYFAHVWLFSFVVCAAAWIWLLIKTIRRDIGDE